MIKRSAAGRARANRVTTMRVYRPVVSGRYLAVASSRRWPATTVREQVPQQVLVAPLSEAARLAVHRAEPLPRADWFEHLRTWVASFNVAAASPASATTVEVAFTLDLADVDAGLDDVTRLVRDHLVSAPSRDTTMAMRADSENPDLVSFQLTSRPHQPDRAVDSLPTSHCGTPAGADVVELETASGPMPYTLPLSLNRDTIGSVEVSQILSASGKPNRALANTKRKAHQLLGIKVANQYRYPTFQFDRERKLIKPQAIYANVAMECDFDPWGTLDWWYSCQPVLNDQRPVDLLDAGALTEHDIDRMIAHDRLGMD